MKEDLFYPSKDGMTQIHAISWTPEGKPRAILQICHGMCEYIDRYDGFAQFLADHGFAVVGNDHLGHGQSVRDEDQRGFFAEENGNLTVLKDLHTLRRMTEEKYPGVPYFIMGHSMGSFLVRQYIGRCGRGLKGAIIMGTGSHPSSSLTVIISICEMMAKKHGWHYRSEKVHKISMGSYNSRYKTPRTKCDWLSKDTEFVDAFVQDPWCMFRFTLNGYYNMFLSIMDCQSPEVVEGIPPQLPMLLIAGLDDPVGNYGFGVNTAFLKYKMACVNRDLTLKLNANDRHELLNETDRLETYDYLLDWMTNRI